MMMMMMMMINYQLDAQIIIYLFVKYYSSTCFETPTNNIPPTVSSHSRCVLTGHHEISKR